MKNFFFALVLCPALGWASLSPVLAQSTLIPPGTISFKKGLGFVDPDSTFSMNIRFRMQNRIMYNSTSQTDLRAAELEARVMRLRLRLEGFMYHPKLTYYVQLSFSRGDMDWNVRDNSAINSSPNVVRDAVLMYNPIRPLTLIFGQTKLPGNRQRVVSSGEQQFVDRSIVNATYNIDRDFGIQAYYTNHLEGFYYSVRTAITTGEGRNVTSTDAGLAYTGRLELLPFGAFTNLGDYFEGDLEREKTPKLSLAGGYSYNEKARRTGGQLGRDLFSQRDIKTIIFDGLLKFRGVALYAEYMDRNVDDPITTSNGSPARYVITGNGQLYQASYYFKNTFEITGRYAVVTPSKPVWEFENQEEVLTGGLNKYLRRHRLKLLGNVSYHKLTTLHLPATRSYWNVAFQIESGI
ncbi:hypothetical protein BH24BAC1_BH24BAC1_13450 [soil metagenome]